MRKVMILTGLILLLIFLGWTFYSGWKDRQIAMQEEEEKAAKDRAFAKAYGENRITILGFYANPGTIRAGEKSQLCYGVSNADKVRIEPPVGDVWPSLSRCLDVEPRQDTVYKLIAEDANGQIQTATTTVKVQ